jgi:uncharacterized protein
MDFEWDERKDRANRAKHGISFEFATRVFRDPDLIVKLDDYAHGEERWKVIGMADIRTLLFVVYTERINLFGNITTRIISARRAKKIEKRAYRQIY